MGKKPKKESEAPRKEGFEPLFLESKTPATVVLLLNSQEEDILVKACEAIHTFAEKGDENRVSLLGLGAVEPLCRLIAHSNRLVRRNAFMALGIMATNGDVNNVLKKVDAIPSMIQNLTPEEDAVVQEFATLCLASLSADFTCRVQIYANNGMPPVIRLLTSSDPDVTKNSLEIIFNLVQDYKCLQAVHELGGIPSLLELLKSDFPVIQRLALKTLQCVTSDKETRETFREEQGFEKLMDILSNMDLADLHGEALHIVANCLRDGETLQLIHNDGGLARLMDFVLAPSTPAIQSTAVQCLSRVAQSCEGRGVLHEQEVEKALVELLSAADDDVKASACQAVAAMSFHPASKDSFRDWVAQLLNGESSALREAATQALSSLTHGSQANALKKKEKEKQYEEAQESPPEKQQNMKEDVYLQMLIREAKESVLPLKDEQEQYAALARLVSKAMGGAVAAEKLHQFQWVLHHSELKFQLKSNVIPIGLINKGIYCHRALLFKCLADCIEKSCTLVRGEYNRAWNEVVLFGEDPDNQSSPQPRRYIVDLMHQPGTLLPVDTPAAALYQTI
uniref:Armadillo repeat containing 3 n=1 Tax=Fundulus heteroclitus TaxID=8078 RepID=A0A3Q2NTY0_FUNHE